MKEKLGNLTKIKTGKLDANASSENGQFPFFTCSREQLKIDSYSYNCECVLVAGNGDLNVKYYNGKFDAYQRTYIIEGNGDGRLYMPYLYYFLDDYVEELRKQAIGGVIKYIKLGNLTDACIELPDYDDQVRIVDILQKSQDFIKVKEKQIEELDQLIKARFVEMFGNKDYQTEKLAEVCSKITDGTHKTPNYLDEGITFISAKNVVNGKLDFNDIKHVSEEEYEEIQKRCNTEKGDVLLTKSGTLGLATVVDTDEKLGLFESLAVIKYYRDKLDGTFLCEQLKSSQIQSQLREGVKGVAVKHLHLNVIGNVDVIVPPLSEQRKYAEFVNQVDKSKVVAYKLLNFALFLTYRAYKVLYVSIYEKMILSQVC